MGQYIPRQLNVFTKLPDGSFLACVDKKSYSASARIEKIFKSPKSVKVIENEILEGREILLAASLNKTYMKGWIKFRIPKWNVDAHMTAGDFFRELKEYGMIRPGLLTHRYQLVAVTSGFMKLMNINTDEYAKIVDATIEKENEKMIRVFEYGTIYKTKSTEEVYLGTYNALNYNASAETFKIQPVVVSMHNKSHWTTKETTIQILNKVIKDPNLMFTEYHGTFHFRMYPQFIKKVGPAVNFPQWTADISVINQQGYKITGDILENKANDYEMDDIINKRKLNWVKTSTGTYERNVWLLLATLAPLDMPADKVEDYKKWLEKVEQKSRVVFKLGKI